MDRLNEVMDAVAKADSVALRELAGYYSDEAAINQGQDQIRMALITYCLHKTFIKIHMREKVHGLVEDVLDTLRDHRLEQVLARIHDFDEANGLFEGGLVGKARIKIASRLHSRGISVARSSQLTGAQVSDILDYVGETRGFEHIESKSVLDRLNTARDIFR